MTDFSQMIRWNAGFVRGLAQSVLERAKTIRTSLTAYSADEKSEVRKPRKKPTVRKAVKRATKAKPRVRRKTHA